MKPFRTTIDIQAPPDVVWSVLIDDRAWGGRHVTERFDGYLLAWTTGNVLLSTLTTCAIAPREAGTRAALACELTGIFGTWLARFRPERHHTSVAEDAATLKRASEAIVGLASPPMS